MLIQAPAMAQSREEWEAEFEKLGVGEVRARLITGVYLQGGSDGYARAWLARKDAEAAQEVLLISRRSDRRSLQSYRIAIAALVIAAASLIVAFFH
jgi:hypothetical protein